MIHLSWLLLWFEAILRLKINLKKSKLIPISRMDVEELAFEIGFKVGGLSSTYVGDVEKVIHFKAGSFTC